MHDEVLNIGLREQAQHQVVEFTEGETLSDEQLVAAVLSGDESAFGEIFERYKRSVAKVIGRFFRDAAEVEEFVQQSFTKVYFSLTNYRGGEERSFPAWITRISVNICYDEFRRRQRKGERLFSEMSDAENEYVDTVADRNTGTEDSRLAAKQLADRMLDSLDPKDRIAMTLIYSEEYSLTEVADAIGISTSNLKSRLFRCRNQIKAKFGYLVR